MNLFIAQSLMPNVSWALIAPELIVCAAAVLVMLIDAFAKRQRWLTGAISMAGLLIAGVYSVWMWSAWRGPVSAFNGMIVLDELRLGFTLIFLLVSFLTLL